eukprot:scaffold232468_cov29-Tisochrysis_lutea.AAC.2
MIRTARARRVCSHQTGEVQWRAAIAILRLERGACLHQCNHSHLMPLFARVVQQRLAGAVGPADVLVARDELLKRLSAQVEVGGCLVEERHARAAVEYRAEVAQRERESGSDRGAEREGGRGRRLGEERGRAAGQAWRNGGPPRGKHPMEGSVKKA